MQAAAAAEEGAREAAGEAVADSGETAAVAAARVEAEAVGAARAARSQRQSLQSEGESTRVQWFNADHQLLPVAPSRLGTSCNSARLTRDVICSLSVLTHGAVGLLAKQLAHVTWRSLQQGRAAGIAQVSGAVFAAAGVSRGEGHGHPAPQMMWPARWPPACVLEMNGWHGRTSQEGSPIGTNRSTPTTRSRRAGGSWSSSGPGSRGGQTTAKWDRPSP